jgi:GTP-binding protein HflX
VLAEIGAGDVPELLVWNKVDRPDVKVDHLLAGHPGSVAISALAGTGVDELLAAMGDRLRAMAEVTELLVPYDRGDVLAAIHREGEVLSEVHDDDGVRLRARLERASRGKLAPYVVGGHDEPRP